MPGCCTTLHVKVLSCNEDGPVEDATVTVTRAGVPPDEPDVVAVASAVTDDTGTVTLLVKEEGTYTVAGAYHGGEEVVTAEAACGINDVTVHFGLTDKICFDLVGTGGGLPDDTTFTVTLEGEGEDEDTEVGTCTSEVGALRCCVDIPGPGTYLLAADTPGATLDDETVVSGTDCGDRIIRVTVPTAGETCERTLVLELCGCPAGGIPITVAIPGGNTYTATTNLITGVATFILQAPDECDAWAGTPYSVDLPGTSTNLTGTVSGDGMTISEMDPPGTWCDGHPEPCFGAGPATLTATFSGGFGGTLVGGTSATLTKTGTFTWKSTCIHYQVGVPTDAWIVLTLVLDPNVVECNPDYAGEITMDIYANSGCGGSPISSNSYLMDSPTSSMCPVYGFFTGPGDKEIEVFP